MRNFLFWKFPNTAEAENGKFPKRESPGFYRVWIYFPKGKALEIVCVYGRWALAVSYCSVDRVYVMCTGEVLRGRSTVNRGRGLVFGSLTG